MDDDNIDNEDNQEIWEEAQAEVEQERIAAARCRRLQLISVLEGFDEIPFQTRNKTDELVENFLEELEDDIHDMLCDNNIEADNYRGLDSDRDTEEEVETVIRFFPDVLTRRGGTDDCYPIQLLSYTCYEDGFWGCNVKAVSFIPIVARLAIELGLSFDGGEERGGLLCGGDDNVLLYLIAAYRTDLQNYETIDNKYLQVLIQLRKIGLLKKEDIQRYRLLHDICSSCYFPEKRFRFLLEWDPIKLTQSERGGGIPLLYAACSNIHSIRGFYSIRGFQLVFEYGIRYFPKKKGINLLFRKNSSGNTPFIGACYFYGYEQVMKIIEDTLIRCYSSSDDTPPLNIEEALMTAAIDKDIHLDCVYFLLRRQPDILQKLLSSASTTKTAAVAADMVAFDNNDNIIN
jgi:hypothetical protein